MAHRLDRRACERSDKHSTPRGGTLPGISVIIRHNVGGAAEAWQPILSIATENSRDVGVLKEAALGANGCRPLGAKVSSALL